MNHRKMLLASGVEILRISPLHQLQHRLRVSVTALVLWDRPSIEAVESRNNYNLQLYSWRIGNLMLRTSAPELVLWMWIPGWLVFFCLVWLVWLLEKSWNCMKYITFAPRNCDVFCQSLLAKLIEKDAFQETLLKAQGNSVPPRWQGIGVVIEFDDIRVEYLWSCFGQWNATCGDLWCVWEAAATSNKSIQEKIVLAASVPWRSWQIHREKYEVSP